MIKNNTTTLNPREMIGSFGCSRFESEILNLINEALANGQLPDFKRYNLEETNCECRTDACCWTEREILDRLEKQGIWEKVKLLAKQPADIPAHRAPGGAITVDGYKFQFVGEYDNYREMDADAANMLSVHPNGYACHVAGYESEKIVLMLPVGSKYIVLVD